MGYDGLMVGLEIHQQLGRQDSTKLFSRARADIDEREPDLIVTRKLRASAGETGSVDIAARAEQVKAKEFVYQAFQGTTSLVELDEEPPQPVNDEAVETVAMVAKACKSTLLSRVQFMRKTIVDGSAVSGFQRTGLMAVGGTIPGLKDKVGVQSICLEEDSAKIVEKTSEKDVYNLSRLGIPLIELATAPDIKTPEQAKEVAAQIGMILRSTGRVKRGLGTIRQDLNVSVTNGERCEIKGAQDLKMVPTIIEYEALRQTELVKIQQELSTIEVSDVMDVSEAFTSSEGFIKKALATGKAVGIRIDAFAGYLGRELCPNYRLGTELAGIAQTWGFGGIIHSDENLEKYGTTKEALNELFSCKEKDAFIILVGDETKARALLDLLIIPRLHQLTKGVPGEVRHARPDGTSRYLRPVPGAARMYPETDIPIVDVNTDVQPPKLITEQIEEFTAASGLSDDLASQIIKEGIPIQEYKEKYPDLSYAYLSSVLLEWPRDITTRLQTDLGDVLAYVEPLMEEVTSGRLEAASVKAILEEIGERNKTAMVDPNEVLMIAKQFESISDEELLKIVEAIVKAQPDAKPNQLMGPVMAKVKGRADGKRVMVMLSKRLQG